MIKSTRLAIGILAGLLTIAAAHAQTARSGGDAAQVTAQLQQLAAERTALQAENARLKTELDSLKAEAGQLQGERDALQRRARASEAAAANLAGSADSNKEALERSRAQTQELVLRFRETAKTLQDVERDRSEARTALAEKDRVLRTCVDRNVGLYELGSEMLAHLEDRDVWSALKASEPFAQLARTRLDNLIEDYRYRIDELRVERERAAAAARPTGGDAKP